MFSNLCSLQEKPGIFDRLFLTGLFLTASSQIYGQIRMISSQG